MMAFPSEPSVNPLGGPPSYIHQLRKGTVAIDHGPRPNTVPTTGDTTRQQPRDKNQHYGVATVIPTMNDEYSNTPQLQGLQNFGGSQPGSEKLIYEPEINVQSIYESVMEVKIPAQSRNPGVSDENIFLNIPQQAPANMDRRTLTFEFDIQVFQNNLPINNALVPAVVWSNYISFVNNLVPSLFKNINFQINNQNLTLFWLGGANLPPP